MLLSSIASSIANAVVGSFANTILKGIFSLDAPLSQLVFTLFSRLPDPQVSSNWFASSYFRLSTLSAFFTLISIFIYIIKSLLSREDPIRLGRIVATLASLPVIFITPTIVLKIFAVDNFLVKLTYGTFNTSSNVPPVSEFLASTSMSPVLGAVLALTFAIAALALTIELALRNAFIYFAVAMVPFVAPFYSLRAGRH